ncbi:NAD(P)H-dependent flavin oxidoreductase [Sinimarinibacterium flocculans]|uniref:Nitronate monooxygenase n=1 Tax=Sinimarinibacterium flocculans TaxID=985250 RepID=A0A318EJY3_9GAMM|nr:nitronate monooxygenase [Sinimarinibacterium flocculans]PXV71202.1 nitronate monooxygenase [Sinimarinibacterium flocculans]
MRMPASWQGRLRIPAIAAPMFIVSNPKLVAACCQSGVVGTFPALNQRTTAGFVEWLETLNATLTDKDAPYGVNLIVHRTNPRLQADLEQVVRHKVPLVITSLGAVAEVVDAVHSYGGVVFHDIVNQRHAEKAAKAGVDGLIPVSAGAGGHAGVVNPFALVPEIRSVFDGYIVLSGCISSGRGVAAARALGADFAYMGTRFIATQEANAPEAYKQMLIDAGSADIVYTPAISGIPANFLRPSIVGAGLDPDNLKPKTEINLGEELSASKAWKDIWSAGQGTTEIRDLPPATELCARLIREYGETCRSLADGM